MMRFIKISEMQLIGFCRMLVLLEIISLRNIWIKLIKGGFQTKLYCILGNLSKYSENTKCIILSNRVSEE
jgi:hypothetical protein